MAGPGKVAAVVVVMVTLVVAVLSPSVHAANIFSAFSRGFEVQEEIQYTVLRQGRGWQERVVPARSWVCTDQATDHNDQIAVFLRLFNYLNGHNDREERLPMGIPVSIEVTGGVTGDGRELRACFFLPESVQSAPPTPADPLVTLARRPPLTVFTREFGGYANDEATWTAETERLRQLVTSNGEVTNPALAYWNAYDPPYKFWNRRNEVWLVKA